MSSGAPWSVKGIDPKAREVAKDLARRSGMTLGEWLNRMIVDSDGSEAEPQPGQYAKANPEPVWIEAPRPSDAPARYEVAGHPADEVGRVAEALERLSERIEAAEQRSTLAITGIDQSVRGALSRLELSEREQTAVAARFEGLADDLRADQGRLNEGLRRLEAESQGPRSAEALRALEGALGKVAGHLYEGEARTRETLAAVEARVAQVEGQGQIDPGQLAEDVVARIGQRLEAAETRTNEALRDFGTSLVKLDGRLRNVEASGGGEARLQELGASLTAKLEAARAEMAEKLGAAAEGRFDRMDRRLAEMTSHVTAAEQRQAQAIERMGREMVSMAETLNRRVATSENRGADALEQVGGEVARIATAVEQRLARADTTQAQAMEKLGSEIARITERLAERIANSERRSALAIDDVGEQVARVTERINQRQERTSVDLAERIRQSEERTAKLLDEAREKIDASLNTAHRKLSEQVTTATAAPAPAVSAAKPRTFVDPFEVDPFPGDAAADEAFAPQAFGRHGDVPAPPPLQAGAFPAPEPEPAFSAEDIEAADAFSTTPAPRISDAPDIPPPPAIAPVEIEEPHRPLSTREVIEQARAAARAAAQAETKGGRRKEAKPPSSLFGGGKKRKAGSTLQTALFVTGAAAALGAGVASYMLGVAEPKGPAPERVSRAIEGARADGAEIQAVEADTAPAAAAFPVEPRAAVALGPITPAVPVPAPSTAAIPPAPIQNGASLYAEGVRRIEAGDTTGLDSLRKAANLGYAQAQFYLAKLYENGQAGLKKDAGEARRWTERAAAGGDRKAMHNLALYYFEGTGGPKNSTTAAQWFRRAADLGLTDSQYNLGRLYEEGYGVSQNAAEAYKWYLIAGRSGDQESRSSAERVKKLLTPEAKATAERSAGGYRASAPNPSTSAAADIGGSAASLVTAQKALSRLGYYQGPQDGTASPALKLAITAYQRDQGLPSTGALDAQVVSRLSAYAR